jgi:hypothetical protein
MVNPKGLARSELYQEKFGWDVAKRESAANVISRRCRNLHYATVCIFTCLPPSPTASKGGSYPLRNRPSPTNYISFGSFGCAQIVCDYVIAGMNGLLWAVRGVAISRFQAHVVS